MLVIGAGVIGVELASVYSRLGSKVTIVELLDCVCPNIDAALSKQLQKVLTAQGLTFHLSTEVTGADVKPGGVQLHVKKGGKAGVLRGNVVLVAVGRKPYTKDLGLQEAGVNVDERGFVTVDDAFRTSVPSIYAIGDVIGGAMLAHKAEEEGISAVEAIAGHFVPVNYACIPDVIYTWPEVAGVGLTEAQAKEYGLKVKIGTFPFMANSRARCTGESDGLVKIIAEANTERVIGLHIFGPNASEMIGEGVIAIQSKSTASDIAHASHAHPTLSEAIKEAAMALLDKAIHM
jgi:dihydrolipoamide dehydrogenase